MARIAVVGPGSVGTYFAAQLAAGGNEVLACARRPFAEYVVDSKTAPLRLKATVFTDPADVPDDLVPVDGVLFCVKAHQSVGAAPWLHRLCGPASLVVVVQNGIEGERRVAELDPPGTVIPSVVYCGAELMEPGHIVHYSNEQLIVPDTEAAATMAPWFDGVAAELRRTPSFATEAWRKLGANAVANGITALTNRSMSVAERPQIALLARRLLEECWAVARAEGADLGPDDVDRFVAAMQQWRGRGGTSMLYDRRAGRPTEHDAIYGAIVRAGTRHGIPTPLCETFDALIAAGDPDDGEG